jgi:SWI/SNF-related matrix-associated actin-dependent regulator of chromatin subfamily A3
MFSLNLAVASRIYILEPQWNPFIEFQAMARAQRLGQTKQVVVVRYIMERTMEQVGVLRNPLSLDSVITW